MSSIIIESSPISSNGFCQSNSGQSIIFTIVSGITSSTVYCEWFLNGNSVYFGSSYILLTPNTNDEVYARVVTCSGETLRIGNWIEDNMFYYNDVPAGVHTYYIDLKASFNYKILSSVFKSNNNGLIQMEIDGTPIVWTGSGTSINISNSITDTEAISSNYVSIGQKVTLITNGTNVIRGKVRFIRVRKNNSIYLPTTTTTTTTLPSSTTTSTTTTTTSSTTSTTTTTMQPILWAIAGTRILRSLDKGSNWDIMYNGSNYLYSISFLDSSIGFATGSADGSKVGAIIKTDNGGLNWYDQAFDLPTVVANKIIFSSSKQLNSVIYFGGNLSTFIKYDKIADSYTDVSKGVSHNSYDIYAFNNGEAISVTSLGASTDYTLKTSNSGSTWNEPITSPQDKTLTGVDFFGNTGILISSRNSTTEKLYKSTDKGDTWSNISAVAFGLSAMTSISFPTANVVYVVGVTQASSVGKFWKSIDSGNSWTDLSANLPLGTNTLRVVKFLSDTEGWIGGDSGKIYYTINGGTTWNSYVADVTANSITDLFLIQT